jgi:hypothetical protein
VRVETRRPDGTTRSTIIWVVVDGDDVFVRSWKGERGYWYQAAREASDDIALLVRGERVPVRAELADDDDSIRRCSDALERKYAGDPSTPGMVRPAVLGTTLRLLPA